MYLGVSYHQEQWRVFYVNIRCLVNSYNRTGSQVVISSVLAISWIFFGFVNGQ